MKRHGRMFIENIWDCWIRKKGKEAEWEKICHSNQYWFADPFLVEDNGKTYFFCEMMDRKCSRGYLGCGEVKKDQDVKVQVFMETTCHLSYPNVFQYNGCWYLIPETSGRRTIELYRAISFPDKWEIVTTLLDGIMAVDTTVFRMNNKYFVFIYEPDGNKNTLSIAELDLDKGILGRKEIVKVYESKTGRPAGNVVYAGGKMYRPTQYGVNYYGEKVIFKEFTFDTDSFQYEETDVYELEPRNIMIPGLKNIYGIHTYNASSKFEVLDCYYERVFLTRPVMLLLKKLHVGGYRFGK